MSAEFPGANWWQEVIEETWEELRVIIDDMIASLNVDGRAPLTVAPDWKMIAEMPDAVRVPFLQNLMQVPQLADKAAKLTNKLADAYTAEMAVGPVVQPYGG